MTPEQQITYIRQIKNKLQHQGEDTSALDIVMESLGVIRSLTGGHKEASTIVEFKGSDYIEYQEYKRFKSFVETDKLSQHKQAAAKHAQRHYRATIPRRAKRKTPAFIIRQNNQLPYYHEHNFKF